MSLDLTDMFSLFGEPSLSLSLRMDIDSKEAQKPEERRLIAYTHR